MDLKEFLLWEQATRDCIDVKKIYVDMADDLVAGILLSQIVYWNLPNKEGKTKLRVKKDGALWLVKGRDDWWDECRIKPRQFDTAFKKLEEQSLVEKKVMKFAGETKVHIRIIWENFLVALQAHLENFEVDSSLDITGINESVNLDSQEGPLDITGINESVNLDCQNPLIPYTENKDIELKIDRERGNSANAVSGSDFDLEFEYLLLKKIVEHYYPRNLVSGDITKLVDPADIWRVWRTKYRNLTINHIYAAIYTTSESPKSNNYDATSIIVKRLEYAQELLIPIKQAIKSNIHGFKQRLQKQIFSAS